jgi:hypothetical protein
MSQRAFVTMVLVGLLLLFSAFSYKHGREQAKKQGQFLLQHSCTRIEISLHVESVYQCDKGVWTGEDIEKMVEAL